MRNIIGAMDVYRGGYPVFGNATIVGQGAGCFPSGGPGTMLTPDQQQQALAQIMAANGIGVYDACPTKAREQVLGFLTPVISAAAPFASGTTINLTAQPQTLFKPHRLYIPSDYAGAVQVNDIKVGNISQFVSSGPVSGRMFTEFATESLLQFDTAQVSQFITLNVTNISGSDLTSFLPSLKGTSVQ